MPQKKKKKKIVMKVGIENYGLKNNLKKQSSRLGYYTLEGKYGSL
jgi:hypothetical protein